MNRPMSRRIIGITGYHVRGEEGVGGTFRWLMEQIEEIGGSAREWEHVDG
ncbi:hypothetical protein [Desmospora profundinema]|uniref:Glycosyltransferase family 1 protein n=1 Tax=Desmospora profundinema TaxID=1571184 RepID=A0ABU1IMP1_9BACL|nr:hypothetical protein [Desmospora profundinema]MDR6225429.1 hypothetical protein [Desmospora profundinema]